MAEPAILVLTGVPFTTILRPPFGDATLRSHFESGVERLSFSRKSWSSRRRTSTLRTARKYEKWRTKSTARAIPANQQNSVTAGTDTHPMTVKMTISVTTATEERNPTSPTAVAIRILVDCSGGVSFIAFIKRTL